MLGQRIGRRHEIVRIGQVGSEQGGVPRRVVGRRFQALGQFGERADLLAAADRFQLLRIAAELDGFLGQAEGQRLRPVNVGAPIKVIADPAGQRRHEDFQRPPVIGERLAGNGNQHACIGQLRIGRMGNCALHLVMLALQADRLVPRPGIGADLAHQHVAAGLGRADHMIGQRRAQILRQCKGRMAREHDAASCLFDSGLEGLEPLRRERFQVFGQAGPGRLGLAAGMLGAEPVGAFLDQVEVHFIGQLGQVRQFGVSDLQVAEQGLRQREHRIGQRVDLNPGGLLTQEGLGGLEGRGG